MHIMRSQILKFVDSKRNISFTLFKKKPNSLYMMGYFIVKNKICGRGKPLIHQATLQKSGFEGQ